MTDQPNSKPAKARPVFRLCFSAKNGVDANGQAHLTYPVEIGAAFERKDPAKGLVAKFHIIPMDFKDGVLFLIPADAERQNQPDLLDAEIATETGQ